MASENTPACCEAGRIFLETRGAGLSDAEAAEVQRIAALYCEIGESLLGQYTEGSWAKLNEYYRYAYEYHHNYGGFTLEQYRRALELYHESYLDKVAGLDDLTGQESMLLFLSGLSDAETAALPTPLRMYALEQLASGNIRGNLFANGNTTEGLILRLVKYVDATRRLEGGGYLPGFASALNARKELFYRLLAGFNDLELIPFIGDQNQTAYVRAMLELFKATVNFKDESKVADIISNAESALRIGKIDGCETRINSVFSGGRLRVEVEQALGVVEEEVVVGPGPDVITVQQCAFQVRDLEEYENIFDYTLVYVASAGLEDIGFEAGSYVIMPAFVWQYLSDDQDNTRNLELVSTATELGLIWPFGSQRSDA